ncbi:MULTISPECIES: AAA family ATPase [unclassified Methylobacterium]|uniref:AAA family ATPase n=1 Tax=unclassified Methylobacterium TaxID=2615210 RepID=UPI00226A6DE6|nr:MULTISPECIES: AAA family ATPase [unclassified Methylobacterium]
MTAGTSTFERPPKPQLPPFAGLPDLPALRELKSRPEWVAWDYFWKEKPRKWDKPPVNARTGQFGSTSDPDTWAPYDVAARHAARNGLPGVGFVLSKDGVVSGIDLDGCRDRETGKLQSWAQVVVDFAETYMEVSPSGEGLRLIVKGTANCVVNHPAGVEIYADGRYLTITGQHVPGTPTEIREAPRTLAYLTERAEEFGAAQQAAADLAREQERKKAEKRAQEQPRQTTSQRAQQSATGGRHSPFFGEQEKDPFWRNVNDRAFASLGAWVPVLFPTAYQSNNGAWRVSSHDLDRDLEEDLSIMLSGAKDFGVRDQGDENAGRRTAIALVLEYGSVDTPAEAALWLCDRIGIAPESLGWRSGARNENEAPRQDSTAQAEPPPERKRIRATPFVYRNPSLIPRREWVYGRHLIRRFLSTTVAPGAVGKSSLVLVEAIAMATGKALLGVKPPQALKVWYVNLEDPLEETERRVAAICLHYGIDARELEGRLFLDSGRTAEIIIATRQRDGVKIAEPVIEDLTTSMAEYEIDHLTVDPFVSSHRVTENANDEIDIVAKAWNRVAEVGNASIELVHHVRKGHAGQGEYTVEDGRGAGALLAAARSARVLNLMSKDQAEKAGIPTNRGFFRVDNGKANLAPPPDKSDWYQLVSVSLGNGPPGILDYGDQVAVVEPWEWPDAFEGVGPEDLRAAQSEVAGTIAAGARWRLDVQSPDWVGIPIARALKLNHDDKAHRSRISRMLRVWIETGMFTTYEDKDKKHRIKEFVEVGTHASGAG